MKTIKLNNFDHYFLIESEEKSLTILKNATKPIEVFIQTEKSILINQISVYSNQTYNPNIIYQIDKPRINEKLIYEDSHEISTREFMNILGQIFYYAQPIESLNINTFKFEFIIKNNSMSNIPITFQFFIGGKQSHSQMISIDITEL